MSERKLNKNNYDPSYRLSLGLCLFLLLAIRLVHLLPDPLVAMPLDRMDLSFLLHVLTFIYLKISVDDILYSLITDKQSKLEHNHANVHDFSAIVYVSTKIGLCRRKYEDAHYFEHFATSARPWSKCIYSHIVNINWLSSLPSPQNSIGVTHYNTTAPSCLPVISTSPSSVVIKPGD